MDTKGRVIMSVVIIGFVSGAMVGAWTFREEPIQTTRAGLFAEPIVDLMLERAGGVNGFVGQRNLAYGDTASGSILVLSSHRVVGGPEGAMDLDIDVRGELRGASGVHRLDDVLIIEWLSYGADDLLSGADGGVDLIREIDANPVVGNGDGKLSFRELGAGVNDLAPPKTRDTGGSPFNIDVSFRPTEESLFDGQAYHVTFVFQLSDVADADLN